MHIISADLGTSSCRGVAPTAPRVPTAWVTLALLPPARACQALVVHHRLVFGCREHRRAGAAAECARAATGGTFRHVLPAATQGATDGRLHDSLLRSAHSVQLIRSTGLASAQASHHRPALCAHGCSSRQRGSVPAFPVCRLSCSVYRQSAADRQIVAGREKLQSPQLLQLLGAWVPWALARWCCG